MDAARLRLLYGPPGTGKTTRLLELVREALARGLAPDRIGFVSFTRRAAEEARDRVRALLPDLPADAFPHFRTLHATAFHALGATRRQMCGEADYTRWLADLGLPVTGRGAEEVAAYAFGGALGDAALQVLQLARARQTTVDAVWDVVSHPELTPALVEDVARLLAERKRVDGKRDFADLLDACPGPLPVDLLIVDEAQDLSPAQWALVERLAAPGTEVVVAGDDDQTIYGWAGADPTPLWTLDGEREVLPVSWRLPSAVKTLADAIAGEIVARVPKAYRVRPGAPAGAVHYVASLDLLELPADGSVLLLARHRHDARHLVRWCRAHGYVYQHGDTWSHESPGIRAAQTYEQLRRGRIVRLEDAAGLFAVVPDLAWGDTVSGTHVAWRDLRWPAAWGRDARPVWYDACALLSDDEQHYARLVRARGESLTAPGRIRISTIHGSKGAEADHVVLLADQTRRVADTWVGAETPARDAEWRVWYVGVTRAALTLTVVGARGRWGGPPLLSLLE